MPHDFVHGDFETGERTGAGGTFQVISLEDAERGADRTDLIRDPGRHYFRFEELREDWAEATGLPLSEITVESA